MLKTNNITVSELPSFTLSESNLGMGASYGNSALWIHTKGTGAIERIFLNDVGRALVGAVQVRYGARARRLDRRVPLLDGHPDNDAYTAIYPEGGTRTFEIHPAYQRVRFRIARVIDIEETTFLPYGPGAPGDKDPPIVYVAVSLHNRDSDSHVIRVTCSAELCGTPRAQVASYFDESAHALVASNIVKPNWACVFSASDEPSRYSADLDFGSVYDASHVHSLTNTVDNRGDQIGQLQFDLTLEPGERRELAFRLTLTGDGVEDALRQTNNAEDASTALQNSIEHMRREICRGRVITPDRTINEGAFWSKVNMRRVMASYSIGNAFTNDPGKYAVVVVRDCAWFVYGNDHFLPEFSRDLLNLIAEHQYPNGKLPEYIDAVDGSVEDYGLNINDDTPLFVLAVNHHFRSTGDVAWLRDTYPVVSRAAKYIMLQIDDRGLVYCSADDPRGEMWAIAGWRNIIPDYKINGAVTELNAECVAALRAAGHLAENLGEHDEDAREFRTASQRLQASMDRNLINPENGLYYLNIDVDGNPRTDVTGDQVFPVMMRACSEETGFRIISRLNCEDFWTEAGLRTVSRYDPRFDPSAHSGLLGGVWPGLTWWYAFGAASYHPEVMVRGLRSSFQHYAVNPKRNNTIPGQFSEWFDGESLENRGMRLSPWEPPRFLWAAVEGVCGLVLQPGVPRVSPLIPSHWQFVGLRELPYHGTTLSYFIVREGISGFRIYSTAPVESDWDVLLYERDVSDFVRVYDDCIVAIALARHGGAAVLIGNVSEQTVQTPVVFTNPMSSLHRFYVRTYDSERSTWQDNGILSMEDLHGNALTIEAGGYRLIEFTALEDQP